VAGVRHWGHFRSLEPRSPPRFTSAEGSEWIRNRGAFSFVTMSTATVPRMPTIPAQPADLDRAWLQEMFSLNGLRGASVTIAAFEQKRIGTGQIGQNVRITFTYDSAAEATAAGAPSTLVAKFVSSDDASRGAGLALGNYEREVDFYRDFAPVLRTGTGNIPPMNVARCWAAEFGAEAQTTILVLDDLAPAEQGDQIAGCRVDDARTAVTQAAILHATFWESPLLASTAWLKDPLDPERAAMLDGMLGMFWPAFKDRYADRLTEDMCTLGDRIAATASRWVLARTGPYTLTHGDYRLDNLLYSPASANSANSADGDNRGSAVAVDWQTPAIGLGGVDIGYFVGAGLLAEDRRAHERDLVKQWHDDLCTYGVANYSLDAAWDDYRHGQFSGFIVAVVASMITERTERGDEMFWAMAGRHLTTALETQAAELLP
jgi:Ecdysteroid kinase-like family